MSQATWTDFSGHVAHSPACGMGVGRARAIFICAILVVYGGMLIATNGLSTPVEKDERHFWPTSLSFSKSLIPTVESLRTYNELNTPLPFVVFGALEYLFGAGIALGRGLNMLLSVAVLAIVGWPRQGRHPTAYLLAAAGLLCCPYFLFASYLLYTDMMAIFFVAVGTLLHLNRYPVCAAVSFVLAISTRQYMVAFPAAIATRELLCLWQERFPRLRPIRDREPDSSNLTAFLAPCLATLSIFGWIGFFDGPAPRVAIEHQDLLTAKTSRFMFASALYSLSCVGVYFVLAELLLFRRWHSLSQRWHVPTTAFVGIILVVLGFALFPPVKNINFGTPSMGCLDLLLRKALSDSFRMTVLALLACLAVIRFSSCNLASLMVAANTAVMLKAHIGWDKYALPVLACLWIITAQTQNARIENPRPDCDLGVGG